MSDVAETLDYGERVAADMAAKLSPKEQGLLIIALEQVSDLIGDSHGVTGLHLNGDVATWDWLMGEWLDTFDEALAPVRKLREERLRQLERQKAEAWTAHQQTKDARP